MRKQNKKYFALVLSMALLLSIFGQAIIPARGEDSAQNSAETASGSEAYIGDAEYGITGVVEDDGSDFVVVNSETDEAQAEPGKNDSEEIQGGTAKADAGESEDVPNGEASNEESAGETPAEETSGTEAAKEEGSTEGASETEAAKKEKLTDGMIQKDTEKKEIEVDKALKDDTLKNSLSSGSSRIRTEETGKEYNTEPITGMETSEGVSVEVSAPEGSFPKGTALSIMKMSRDESDTLVSGIAEGASGAAFDISFYDEEGNKVQPLEGKSVDVRFTLDTESAVSAEIKDAKGLQIYHIGESTELLAETVINPESNEKELTISAEATEFSPYIVVMNAEPPIQPAQLPPSGSLVDANITRLELHHRTGELADSIFVTDTFRIEMDWEINTAIPNLHNGDYFEVRIPDLFWFPDDVTSRDFPIEDGAGNIVANVHLEPGADNNGGVMTVTLLPYVENKLNVRGSLYLAARFNRPKITEKKVYNYTVEVGPRQYDRGILVTVPRPLVNEVLNKWAGTVQGHPDQASWNVRINHKKDNLTNVVIKDKLTDAATGAATTGERFIRESFVLRKLAMNEFGDTMSTPAPVVVDITDKLSFNADMSEFTLNLGDIGTDQYKLVYYSTYTPGTRLKNMVELSADGVHEQRTTIYKLAESGGSASGSIAGKIKIIKRDAADTSKRLPGARFTVTDEHGTAFDLTTGADGTVTSNQLVQGQYKVREVDAPIGYDVNPEEFTVNIRTDEGAVLTVDDAPAKTDVHVKKIWKAPVSDITVHLLDEAGNKVQIKTIRANEVANEDAEGWLFKFENVDKYKNGNIINYSVSEEPVLNAAGEPKYEVEIVDHRGGALPLPDPLELKIINKDIETRDIKVKKRWIGALTSPVNVELLADGVPVETATLDAAGGWQYTFTDKPKNVYVENLVSPVLKYKNYREIQYTVRETQVEGYSTRVSGNVNDGFLITNTSNEKINVSVTKQWVGGGAGSVRIDLLADGNPVGSIELNEAMSWTYTFEGLARYNADDGHIIDYKVREAEVEGYSSLVSGSAENGYIVVNMTRGGEDSPGSSGGSGGGGGSSGGSSGGSGGGNGGGSGGPGVSPGGNRGGGSAVPNAPQGGNNPTGNQGLTGPSSTGEKDNNVKPLPPVTGILPKTGEIINAFGLNLWLVTGLMLVITGLYLYWRRREDS